MLTDADLFDSDLAGTRNLTDPLRGEEPEDVLERIVASSKRKSSDWIMRACRDALADRLALRANMSRADADQVLLAHHQLLRRALVQAGRGQELGDPERTPLPEGIAKLAGRGRTGTFASTAEAGDELDRRTRAIVHLIGAEYGTAMREAGRADQKLAAAYMGQAAPEAAPVHSHVHSHDDAVTFRDPVSGVLHIGRRIDPRNRIPGKTYLLKMGPAEAGGGMFEVEG
jgi:hypothetical protein